MRVEDIEIHLGRRVLERREALAWSQNALAKELGVSTTQFRKYEGGENRISAETLYRIAILFDVEIGFFYEGLPGVERHGPLRKSQWSVVRHAESLEAILDPEMRKAVMALIDRATPPRAEGNPGRPA
ncbi:helix-turn-helix domain-containing protein [Aureimonas pseudogalii]|uniref:Transcriptional regulator with XRE-family HTH domain n=1 Tax=Aureimonas pseudogalii TaxID=1744844 RepID=A0A7W6E8R7_9HYPH|nr:helix-turn-helix transcriptional regulator [Aureimonas pseudogalii]MBB3996846.1 transcriptional regulator with XRE-family HTH domain [Aureimonas pseudogalii]